MQHQQENYEGYDVYVLCSAAGIVAEKVRENPYKYRDDIMSLEEVVKELNQVLGVLR